MWRVNHVGSLAVICACVLVAGNSARADDGPDSSDTGSITGIAPPGAPAPATDSGAANDNEAVDNGLVMPKRRRRVAVTKHVETRDNGGDGASGVPLTSAASSDDSYQGHRVQVFLIPLGGSTVALPLGPVQAALESQIAKMPGYFPADLVADLAAPIPAPEREKIDEAHRAIKDGNNYLAQARYADAIDRYQHALDLLVSAGPASEVAQFADTYVRLAISLQYAGEDEPAKVAFQNAARLDQARAIHGRDIDPVLGKGLERARRAIAAGPVGTLSFVTDPPGARVYVDGVYRGPAPVSVDNLPVGINLVRLDMPGAFPVMRPVEVKEGRDVPVRVEMHFTQETQELQHTLSQVPQALADESGVPDMVTAVARRFHLERCVVATVRIVRTNVVEVRMALFDLHRGARLNDERGLFRIDSANLQGDVAAWARGVIDRADRSRNRSASDPLDRSDGTEGWYDTENTRAKAADKAAAATSDNSGSNSNSGSSADSNDQASARPADSRETTDRPPPSRRKKKHSKDPLDQDDGTADW